MGRLNLYGNRYTGMANTTGTGIVQLQAAPTNGLKIWVRNLIIYNSDATLTTGVLIKSGTTDIFGPIPAPAAGGAVLVNLIDPLECNINEALQFQALDAVNRLYVTARGFISVP